MTAQAGLTQDALYSCSHMATVGVKGLSSTRFNTVYASCLIPPLTCPRCTVLFDRGAKSHIRVLVLHWHCCLCILYFVCIVGYNFNKHTYKVVDIISQRRATYCTSWALQYWL